MCSSSIRYSFLHLGIQNGCPSSLDHYTEAGHRCQKFLPILQPPHGDEAGKGLAIPRYLLIIFPPVGTRRSNWPPGCRAGRLVEIGQTDVVRSRFGEDLRVHFVPRPRSRKSSPGGGRIGASRPWRCPGRHRCPGRQGHAVAHPPSRPRVPSTPASGSGGGFKPGEAVRAFGAGQTTSGGRRR